MIHIKLYVTKNIKKYNNLLLVQRI